jgi:hypothetical protein
MYFGLYSTTSSPLAPSNSSGGRTVKRSKTVKAGRVKKIIKPYHPSVPEKAEIEVHDADHLYREIRIDNALQDDEGHKVKLKEHANVDVVIEAEPKATVPESEKEHE